MPSKNQPPGKMKHGVAGNGIPIAPQREDYSDVTFTPPHNRTLMVGRDLSEPEMRVFTRDAYKKIAKSLLSMKGTPVDQLNSLQRAAWAQIENGRNCAIIGSARKGKSLSYLAPIVHCTTNSANTIDAEQNDMAVGPVGLILCGTNESAHRIHSALSNLFAGDRLKTLIVNDDDSKALLKETTDFVVTTLPTAVNLYQNYFEKFQFQRLRFLVFDDIQILFNQNLDKLHEFIINIDTYRSKLDEPVPIQLICCGTDWNENFASIAVNASLDMVILIDSSFAALRYGNVDFQFHDLPNEDGKCDAILRICQATNVGSCIVVCKEARTVERVRDYLENKEIQAVVHCLHHEGFEVAEKIESMKFIWKNSRHTEKLIFVLTDAVLKHLEISDATCIIHFDITSEKKGGFIHRHISMWDNFPNVLQYNEVGDVALLSKVPLKSHIFVSRGEKGFHQLVLKLHSIGVSIPDDLYESAVEQNLQIASKLRLCEALKQFGRCSNSVCQWRHHFTKAEVTRTTAVPRLGRVQLELLKLDDVNVYMAKLLSYYDVVNGKKVNVINIVNRTREIKVELQAYFSQKENMVQCQKIRCGTHCAVQNQETLEFLRCRVTTELTKNSEEPLFRVFCIDEGNNFVRRASQLYILPQNLSVQLKPPVCVQVYVAGLKPLGNDTCFNSNSREIANRFIGKIYTGKIVLAMGNDLWVSPLVEHKVGAGGEWLQVCNLRLEIMKTLHVAENNLEHMELLYQNFETAGGTSCKSYRANAILGNDLDTVFHQKGGAVEWAFLPLYSPNGTDPAAVYVWCTYFSTLSLIFVQQQRSNCLRKLIDELDYEVELMIEDKYQKYDSIFEEYYEVGLPVAAFQADDRKWSRGMIVDKKYKNGEVEFEIFFVDHGDFACNVTMKDLFPLKQEFVTKLPFQAILVRCAHIVPVDSTDESSHVEWRFNQAIDKLIKPHLISEPDQIAHRMEISAHKKKGHFIDNGVQLCKMYDAYLLSPLDARELGEIVVENKLGKYVLGGEDELQDWKNCLLKKWNDQVNASLEFEDEDSLDDNPLMMSDEEVDELLGFKNTDHPEKINTAKRILTDFGVDRNLLENALSASSVVAAQKRIPESIVDSMTAKEVLTEFKSASGFKIEGSPQTMLPNVPQLKKPTVEWSQTPIFISIRIHIPDLLKYSLDLLPDMPEQRLTFCSEVPDGYGFELDLVGKVLPSMDRIHTGQYLTVKLKKLSPNHRWPYLVKGKPSLHWLKLQLDEKSLSLSEREGYGSDEEEPFPLKRGIESVGGFDEDDSEEDEYDCSYFDDVLEGEEGEGENAKLNPFNEIV